MISEIAKPHGVASGLKGREDDRHDPGNVVGLTGSFDRVQAVSDESQRSDILYTDYRCKGSVRRA